MRWNIILIKDPQEAPASGSQEVGCLAQEAELRGGVERLLKRGQQCSNASTTVQQYINNSTTIY